MTAVLAAVADCAAVLAGIQRIETNTARFEFVLKRCHEGQRRRRGNCQIPLERTRLRAAQSRYVLICLARRMSASLPFNAAQGLPLIRSSDVFAGDVSVKPLSKTSTNAHLPCTAKIHLCQSSLTSSVHHLSAAPPIHSLGIFGMGIAIPARKTSASTPFVWR